MQLDVLATDRLRSRERTPDREVTTSLDRHRQAETAIHLRGWLRLECQAGVEPLRRLCGLLPELRVVMLHGVSARDGWARLVRRHPQVVAPLEVVPTFHTSDRAFIGSSEVRADRMTALREAFARTASVLHRTSPHPASPA